MNNTLTKIVKSCCVLLICIFALSFTASAKTISTPAVSSLSSTVSGVKIKIKTVKSAKKYYIYKKTSKDESYSKIASTSEASYTDKSVKTGKTYYYTVKAVNGKDKSKRSKAASIKYIKPITAKNTNDGGVKVSFAKISGASKYIIYRKINTSDKWKKLAETKSVTYLDKKVKNGVEYSYKVKVVKSGKTTDYKSKPASVVYIKAVDVSKAEQILDVVKITLPKLSNNTIGYQIFRCEKGGKYKKIGNTSARVFKDKTVKGGKTYYYKLKAYGGIGISELSKKAKSVVFKDLNANIADRSAPAFSEAFKRNAASEKYIKEILDTNSNYLLQVSSGSQAEIRYLKKFADSLTSKCKNNTEKVSAIYNWVRKNISYEDMVDKNGVAIKYSARNNAHSIDAFRDRAATCFGQAHLTADLLRLSGIPAAVVTGYTGDMKNTLTEKNMIKKCDIQHSWVKTIADGKWFLLDTMMERFITDKNTMAAWYYSFETENIVPYYTNMNMKPFGKAANFESYAVHYKGKNYIYPLRVDYCGIGSLFNRSYNVNFSSIFTEDYSAYYSLQKNHAMDIQNQLGQSEWVFWNVNCSKNNKRRYFYSMYNGQESPSGNFSIDGKNYFTDGNVTLVYDGYTGGNLITKNGCIALVKGEKINIREIECEKIDGKTNKMTPSNKSIIKTTPDGKLTALKEGYCELNINGFYSMSVFVVPESHKLANKDLASAAILKTAQYELYKSK